MGEMNVLITGADGFIGSKLTEHLAINNFHVYALTFSKSKISEILNKYKNIKAIDVDLNENISLDTVLNGYKFDIIVHAAFVTSYESFNDINDLHVNVNLISTCKFIQYAVNQNVGKFIFLSSAGIYYNQNKENINSESRKLRTDKFYFLAKSIIEKLIKFYYFNQFKTKFIILRVGTIFGENERETDSRRTLSIPTQILNIVKNNKIIKINTLNVYRDYCYIDNVSYVISRFIEYNNLKHLFYNVGSDSVFDICDIFNILLKNDIKINYKICKKEYCNILLDSHQNRSGLDLRRLKNIINEYPFLNFENSIIKTYLEL